MSTQEQRRKNRRKVRPGFPVERAFSTIEEAQSYLDVDRLTCLLCGRKLKALGVHLLMIHGMAAEDYHFKYGIPVTLGLTGTATKEKKIANGKKYVARIGPAAALERIDTARKAIDRGYAQRLVSTVSTQRQLRIQTVLDTSPVVRQCSVCGCDFTVGGAQALKKSVKCPSHLSKRIARDIGMTAEDKQRIKEWSAENAERSETYYKAKNWWGWQKNPFPLLEYAKKYNAHLRIMPQLLAAASKSA